MAYLYRKNGSYKFTAGDPVLKSVEDVIEGQPITIEFVVPPREITSVDVALPIPKEKDENLANIHVQPLRRTSSRASHSCYSCTAYAEYYLMG